MLIMIILIIIFLLFCYFYHLSSKSLACLIISSSSSWLSLSPRVFITVWSSSQVIKLQWQHQIHSDLLRFIQIHKTRNSPITILIKDPKSFSDILTHWVLLDLHFHHLEELTEIQWTIAVVINLQNDILTWHQQGEGIV